MWLAGAQFEASTKPLSRRIEKAGERLYRAPTSRPAGIVTNGRVARELPLATTRQFRPGGAAPDTATGCATGQGVSGSGRRMRVPPHRASRYRLCRSYARGAIARVATEPGQTCC